MRRLLVALVVIVAMFIAEPGFARGAAKDLVVNLKFDPQENVKTESPDLPPSMLERTCRIQIEDARVPEAGDGIGRGTNDNDHYFQILASADPLVFTGTTVNQIATLWGLKTAATADRILTLKVIRLWVEEGNRAVGSTYAAEVKLSYLLADRSGKTIAEGGASADTNRYGRARSGANCSEVLSDAIKAAFSTLLADPALQAAWMSGKSSAPSGPKKEEGSVEERLRRLDDLLEKGLITKQEYDQKRAKILAEL